MIVFFTIGASEFGNDPDPEAYGEEEWTKFTFVITDERDALACELFLKIGPREPELANLEWPDVTPDPVYTERHFERSREAINNDEHLYAHCFKGLVWQTRFDSPWRVADTSDSVRQGTTDPRQGKNPTCLDPDSLFCTFFQPVSAGHRRT